MPFAHFARDESGQTAVEYAAVIALVAIVFVVLLATGMSVDLFNSFWSKISDALS